MANYYGYHLFWWEKSDTQGHTHTQVEPNWGFFPLLGEACHMICYFKQYITCQDVNGFYSRHRETIIGIIWGLLTPMTRRNYLAWGLLEFSSYNSQYSISPIHYSLPLKLSTILTDVISQATPVIFTQDKNGILRALSNYDGKVNSHVCLIATFLNRTILLKLICNPALSSDSIS